MVRYRWVGTHAYRDHRNDRVIESGEEIGEDAGRIAEAHPHDVERIDEDEEDGGDGGEEAIDEFDIGEFVDQSASDQVDAIEAGDVDPLLTAIRETNAEKNEYSTVEEAVDERLDELES